MKIYMKNLVDRINEAKEYVQSAGGGDATITAHATVLEFMALMAMDWMKNPNKSADFYKGDGGQTVAATSKDIEKVCKEMIAKADDIQNEY